MNRKDLLPLLLILTLAGLLAAFTLIRVFAAPSSVDMLIYTDSLTSPWENWSWDTNVNLANSSPVHGGTHSTAVTFQAAWAGLYLHHPGVSTAGYTGLSFWIHGGSQGGQKLRVVANGGSSTYSLTAAANSWTHYTIPLSALGNPTTLQDLYWQDSTGGSQPVFYLDDITLVGNGAAAQALSLSVNASSNRHSISPDIYGMNYASENLAKELALPVRRWGGNSTSRYNWKNDTSNHASDWYFENIPEDNPNPAALPNGSFTDRFVEQDRRTGTRTILTMPLMGYTPKARAYACGFSIAKYGAQSDHDPWRPDCGNGLLPDSSPVTGNNPADTSTAIGPAFVQDWIRHLVSKYKVASQGGVKFYNLDNEPMLWNSTHRDVHPNPTSYDELLNRTLTYAPAIKAVDPSAMTLGPVLFGWTAYFYSALDEAPGGDWWNHPADRLAHGDTPFVEWYLAQMNQYQQQHGQRILDYLDLHYYPQESNVALSGQVDATTQALRLRSTRSLWDPTYIDESWINTNVMLIPRMKDWVQKNYPGTKTAVTEYNWGALDNINGALAQADVLGIFGREGLDLATLWAPPSASEPGAYAFRMYRNYDGSGSKFGETNIQAASTDQGQLAIYAAQRSNDRALTLVVINKTGGSLTSPVALSGFQPLGSAQVYRYSTANLQSIVHLADITVTSSGFTTAYPANSITLIVIPSAPSPAPTQGANATYLPLTVK